MPKLMEDGSLLFSSNEELIPLRMYSPNPTNDRHFIAKFEHPTCKARYFAGGMSACGKNIIFKWKCKKYDIQFLTLDHCEGCKEPDK